MCYGTLDEIKKINIQTRLILLYHTLVRFFLLLLLLFLSCCCCCFDWSKLSCCATVLVHFITRASTRTTRTFSKAQHTHGERMKNQIELSRLYGHSHTIEIESKRTATNESNVKLIMNKIRYRTQSAISIGFITIRSMRLSVFGKSITQNCYLSIVFLMVFCVLSPRALTLNCLLFNHMKMTQCSMVFVPLLIKNLKRKKNTTTFTNAFEPKQTDISVHFFSKSFR